MDFLYDFRDVLLFPMVFLIISYGFLDFKLSSRVDLEVCRRLSVSSSALDLERSILENRFVQKAIALALTRDGSSGGMVRTLTITKDKAQRLYEPYKRL